jgi:hypothetical protein
MKQTHVDLAVQLVDDERHLLTARCGRLRLAKVHQDGKVLRRQKVPVDKRVVLPSVLAADDHILAGRAQIGLDQGELGVLCRHDRQVGGGRRKWARRPFRVRSISSLDQLHRR